MRKFPSLPHYWPTCQARMFHGKQSTSSNTRSYSFSLPTPPSSSSPSPPTLDHLPRIIPAPSLPYGLPSGSGPSLAEYLRATLTSHVYALASETPLTYARLLSSRSNNSIYFKREDLQPVFSFKLRGAYNKMHSLSEEEKKKGVLTCSAGNHAQGVALSARHLGMKATILMPVFTPKIKVNAVERLGAEVILHGNDFDSAAAECRRLSAIDGRILIHPYDDPAVITGQATIALELLRQWPSSSPPSAIFISVGGGGLIAGISTYIKSLLPSVKIIGVEANDADAMTKSLQKKERVTLSEVGLFADGAAVRSVGVETFRIASALVDDMVLVTNDEICAAIKDTFEDTRNILEPAGALAVAGCKKYISTHSLTGHSFICVASGANMNFNRLRFVSERAELGEAHEALLAVTIPERPGAFMALYRLIYPRSVTEFSYRYHHQSEAHIYLSFEVKDRAEVQSVIQSIELEGMKVVDISDNDMAKDHTRHLAGGRSVSVRDERIFRFTFPERPGALMRFLTCLAQQQPSDTRGVVSKVNTNSSSGWNVSLFHYRNYGSDTGKVLAGVQVPPSQSNEFQHFLNSLGYPYVEETNNPVYKQFLL